MSFKIEWAPSPNHSSRNGQKPIAIVNHITAGNFPGCLNWMQNPKAQASAHYLITKDGRIYQLVKDKDASWHAGRVNKPNWPLYNGRNPNRYTIGIEHEGFDGSLTDIQYQATLWLHRHLVEKWGIPVDKDHIIGHYRIDSVNRPNCPGPKFPWDRLFTDLKGGGNVGDSNLNLVINERPTNVPLKVVNGRTQALLDGHWVQLRTLAELLHAEIEWRKETKTVAFKVPPAPNNYGGARPQ